jgi:hypothetical protein
LLARPGSGHGWQQQKSLLSASFLLLLRTNMTFILICEKILTVLHEYDIIFTI